MEPHDLYETYVRTAEGETYHPDDIRDGLRQFLSNDGYRISFNIEGVVITLRRGVRVDEEMLFLDDQLGQLSVDCCATIRNLQ